MLVLRNRTLRHWSTTCPSLFHVFFCKMRALDGAWFYLESECRHFSGFWPCHNNRNLMCWYRLWFLSRCAFSFSKQWRTSADCFQMIWYHSTIYRLLYETIGPENKRNCPVFSEMLMLQSLHQCRRAFLTGPYCCRCSRYCIAISTSLQQFVHWYRTGLQILSTSIWVETRFFHRLPAPNFQSAPRYSDPDVCTICEQPSASNWIRRECDCKFFYLCTRPHFWQASPLRHTNPKLHPQFAFHA